MLSNRFNGIQKGGKKVRKEKSQKIKKSLKGRKELVKIVSHQSSTTIEGDIISDQASIN